MQPPIKGVPTEVNRRLDELSRKTRRETIIKTIREIPVVGYQSYPTVSLKENIDLGEWVATDTSIKLSAQPSGEYMYEFAIQKTGEESWDAKITKENTVIFAHLRPDTSYNCKVRSLNFDGGYSPWSSLVMVVTTKDTTPPPVPEGLSLVADFYYVRAKVDEIKAEDYPDFAGFEFHASTVTGFTPSDSTFKDSCRTTRTIFHVSDVGITWYVKVRSFDNNGNYSDYCTQVSVVVPVPHLPPIHTDPTDPGDIVIVEGTEELDDCDDHTKWTAEVGGIQLATDTGTLKEGAGALKISIDKYAPVAENLWYSIPNPPWPPQIPGTFIIGGPFTKYVVQGFKVDGNCDLKREAIIAWIGSGTPPGLKVMLYDDDGAGNPDNLLGTATFAGVNADEYWRFAEYAAAISITADTQYHKVYCRTDEGTGDYYEVRVGINNYSDGIFQYGNALTSLTKDETKDVIFRCFDDTATLNQHFKITTLGAKDISTYENIEYWIKSDKTVASWLQASMGEAALGEQTDNITPGTTWGAEAWNISGIAAASRNAIAHFGFKVLDSDPLDDPPNADDGKVWVWVDYIRATKERAVKVKFTDNVITLWPQFGINIADYGVTGNDITTPLAAALAKVTAAGATILIPIGPWEHNGTIDFTSLPGPVRLLGETYHRGSQGAQITFTHIDSSNCIVMANKCGLESLKLVGSAQTGHGVSMTGTIGGCLLRDLSLANFGDATHDGLHLDGAYINEFYNVSVTGSGRDNIYLDNSNENRFYSCQATQATRYDIHIESGGSNHNHFDVDTGDGSAAYSIYVEKGHGNWFWCWHDGTTDKLAYLGENTGNNYMWITGGHFREVIDDGAYNQILNTEGSSNRNSHPSTVRIKNWVRNPSFLANTTGWVQQAGATLARVATDGISTGTCASITFPKDSGEAFANGAYEDLKGTSGFDIADGDLVVISFWGKLNRAYTASSLEAVYCHITGNTGSVQCYPPVSGGKIDEVGSVQRWRKYTYVFRATADFTDTAQYIHFRGYDTHAITDLILYVTDIQVTLNPGCNPLKIPFVLSGTTDKHLSFPRSGNIGPVIPVELPIMDAALVAPQPGTVVIADGDNWDPLSKADSASYLVYYGQVNLVSDDYKWTAGGGGTNEYYCELAGGGDPSLNQPAEVYIDGVLATKGTVDSLNAGEWDYADSDGLGYSTVYVRLSGEGDPDAQADGHILARRWTAIDGSGK